MYIQNPTIEIVGLGYSNTEIPNNIVKNTITGLLLGVCIANYSNILIQPEHSESKSQLPVLSTGIINDVRYVKLTDAERLDILKGFVQKIANSQDSIPPEFEESFRKNRFSLFARS